MAPSRLIVLSAVVLLNVVGWSSCENATAFDLFSTRTLYDDVRGSGIRRQPGCSPVALWALVRSGVSNPSPSELQEFARLDVLRDRILENHDKWNSGDLSEQTLESLRSWSHNVDSSNAGLLSRAGFSSVRSLVERLQAEFPNLLSRPSPRSLSIRHNGVPKSIETADLISSILYNTTFQQANVTGAKNIDETLGGNCPLWSRALATAESRAQEFRESPQFTEAVQNISRRLGFNRLSLDLLRTAYKLCSYDRASREGQRSAWCSIFNRSELEIFEYEEDILSFHSSGHGNPEVGRVGCDFIRVFLQNFSVHRHNANVNIQVANSVFIRSALAALGVAANGTPLTSANFENAKDRSWRNSFLSPFSGNIVAVLNQCGNSQRSLETVSLFVNEMQVSMPLCGGSQFCELSRFQRMFSAVTNPAYCNSNC